MLPTDHLSAPSVPAPMVLIVDDDPDLRSMAATAVDQVDANRAEATSAEDLGTAFAVGMPSEGSNMSASLGGGVGSNRAEVWLSFP